MFADKSPLGKTRVFLLSLAPRLNAACRDMAAAHLSPSEAELFACMSRYDRAHSVLVARLLADDEMLVRAALLHDTGKLRSALPAWFRTGYTAAEILARGRLEEAIRRVDTAAGEGTCRERLGHLTRRSDRAFFVQSHHGELGAEILGELGCELEVARIVRYHQGVPGPDDEALKRFIRADSAF